jgi:hypothetical protein
VKSALKLASIFVMIFVVAMLLVEWMIGCGESYVDANGVRHQYECAFIPQSKESK